MNEEEVRQKHVVDGHPQEIFSFIAHPFVKTLLSLPSYSQVREHKDSNML